ncbi:hypothetical protein [Desulfofalx alkaliphila]|uniref:hypothetical protein n=1 Tax=Desulfofalx alkaliphila TaxID=105483 RepID=UPI00146FB03D|nr:hypothetical protein [Desulfofalx alkaliphila]
MRLYSGSGQKICYRDSADRVGRVYLNKAFVDELELGDDFYLQIANSKNEFPNKGYRTRMIPKKATLNKVRYHESLEELGEIGDLYISKEILEYLGVIGGDVAVRIVSTVNFSKLLFTGGETSAAASGR